MKSRRQELAIRVALLAILVMGAAFRLYNVNWDKGTYHIHPDERNTAMVVTAIQWPSSLAGYFDTSRSLLNPSNVDRTYFYGTLPLFLTKFVATQLDQVLNGSEDFSSPRFTDYDQIHLVGRVLSALFDLATVLVLFFLARRLFNWRVGLIASFLLALAVLNIQGSHYFAVDTFLTFFVTLTLWFTLDLAEGKGWPSFLGAGLSLGLTMSCKVSTFLLVLIVLLGAWIGLRRRLAEESGSGRAMARVFAGLALAGIATFAAFRVAQPYAWAGPNYDGWDSIPEPWRERVSIFQKVPEPIRAVIMPSPEWIADIVSAGAQQTGEADMPWGRQWTERARWIYPLENMVLWGLGVPLALAAWAGVGLVSAQLLRAWRRRSSPAGPAPGAPSSDNSRWLLVVIPLAWVVLLFVWQGAQFVKSVRYFLPIYPCLALFAAYLVAAAWEWAKSRGRAFKAAAGALAAFVLAGALAWAFAFIQIYTEPVTRVQATQWIYDNIEPGSVIANEHFDDPLPFNMFGKLAWEPAGLYYSLDVTYPGSEDRIDQLQLYDEDTPEKLVMLLDALDQADYIIMSSGRLSTSIPRLPMRYPMTTRYYQLLLAGELGFEKAIEFHSYPRLFGIEFNDDSAEEQFTVYDHPKVLIYRKTNAYDRTKVRTLLNGGIDWASVAHWLNPRDVPEWKRTHQQNNELLLTPEQRQVQEEGGTWASIFNRNSLVNRWPTVTWYLLATVLGLVTLPLTVAALGWLPDRGYILARPTGVLLLAWLSWILTNVTPLHYTRGTILLALGLIALASAVTFLFPGQRRRFVDLWRTRRRLILVSELLFLLFFVLFWLIRWGNPDLWHAWKGGEKPMDFAYLNAVIKSTEFPPYDPWFAGGYLNYYYFGQVMVGTLIKLIGIVPAVAYNLTIALWFAMTAMAAFSVTYNLAAGKGWWLGRGSLGGGSPPHPNPLPQGERGSRRPYLFGLVGALFVAVLGNLGQIHLLLLKLGEGAMNTFDSTIPGLAWLVRTVIGAFELIFGGRALPVGIDEWYWNASRAIPTPPGEAVITEFPFFTFLYADLHAHLIALPLTFLSLAAALALVKGAEDGRERGRWARLACLGPLLLMALAIGAMRCTNTWDVPPHLLVALGALSIAEYSRQGRLNWRMAGSVAWQLVFLFILSWSLLYAPFWASYGSYYNSIALWKGGRTPLWAYLVVHGLFLFAIASYLIARAAGWGRGLRPDPLLRRMWLTIRHRATLARLRGAAQVAGVRNLPASPLTWLGLGLLIVLVILFLISGHAAPGLTGETGLSYKSWAVFALGLPLAVLGLLLLFRTRVSPTERLWAYLVLLGLAMTLGVEVIVIQGDIGRMNTVFKFYMQVWLIWGVTAAAALAWLLPRLSPHPGAGDLPHRSTGRTAWLSILVILIGLTALYPPLATRAKISDRFDPSLGPSLDGWAYMTTSTYGDPAGQTYELKWDWEAIQWLLDNLVGTPTILEGQVPEYRWGARYSINTGLPTVLGWNWHQRQQRAAVDEQDVWKRAEDVADIYNTTNTEAARVLLDKYGVRYVVVGPLERVYYTPEGLAKFDRMEADGTLQVVYRNEGVTIYTVVE
ncbi:MAG: glycosyltransferase family 39 protein [Anaerolineae bacterium]|nr:glycosyltransferase family 39 protein [Anaerolineae bacterium]